ncbi:hypothetical protein [Bdellovibrio bacteriovorus]|uniref:Uncharacterized protein n=1 Tax=Bdellovibrio bacteriovorus TaxID=959 RepID=A0A1Z3N8D9_BDEBC|nr:hypothetical protein [Bdellovibrio bacteriovorus]ASD63716.1 hypothetical protein B9G79_09080 [Bdellovibrio bacteriovorus]
MADAQELTRERAFLHDVGVNLNGALFIVERLIEEIKEEEGRLENDSEIERLFNNLATRLAKIDSQVKSRHNLLSELLDLEIQNEKRKSALRDSSYK